MTGTALGATLTNCDDPRLLVPGSPGALRGDSEQLDQQARALTQQAAETRKAHPTSWTGTAADGWANRREQFAQTLDTVAQIHATAASTLLLHADALEWGQGRAATAVSLYARGCALRDAELGPSGALLARGSAMTDAGAGHRQLAEDVLASAQDQVAASARAASAVLDELAAGLPDGRWHLGDFAQGMWSWVTGITDVLWKFNAIRGLLDSKGMYRDGREMAGAAVDTYDSLADDPIGTTEQLAQLELLRDRPAQWWGRLSPDIALAAAGGAGAATRALRGLSAAEEVASAGSDLSAAARGLYQAGSRWDDPLARARWIDELYDEPLGGRDASRRAVTSNAPWARYQIEATGSEFEYRVTGGDRRIWADHVRLDPDGVTAMDAKHVQAPGRSAYDGGASPARVEKVMAKFDDEIERYVAVIQDESNPIARVRIPTSTEDAVTFLQNRVDSIVGAGVDIEVYYQPKNS